MQSILHLAPGRTMRLRGRTGDRRRLQLVADLRSVARRAGTGARARRYDVLLRNRAALVRPQILEVAAALERVTDPGPETLRTLDWLLTDGCASPLFNVHVPTGELMAALDRAWLQLDAREDWTLGAPVARSRVRGVGGAARR